MVNLLLMPPSFEFMVNKILNVAFIIILVITILFAISLFVMREENTKKDLRAIAFLVLNLVIIRVLNKM